MNVDSILWKGIDPDYAEGNFKRCWFVRWHGIVWALAHISFRKRIPIWQLVAFRVLIEEGDLTHFNRNVYTCKKVVKSKDFRSAERVLSQWERQRVGKGNATKRYERALRARRAMSREAEERGSLPRSGTSPDLDSSTAPVASNVRASN
jgi:hypothetical protein